jgi:hypothetical protein
LGWKLFPRHLPFSFSATFQNTAIARWAMSFTRSAGSAYFLKIGVENKKRSWAGNAFLGIFRFLFSAGFQNSADSWSLYVYSLHSILHFRLLYFPAIIPAITLFSPYDFAEPALRVNLFAHGAIAIVLIYAS